MILTPIFIYANTQSYIQLSKDLKLSETRYWNLLLHMKDGVSEIDDPDFFLSKKGKYNAQNELEATLNSLLNEKVLDDNATACRYPARKAWLVKELDIKNLPEVHCKKYNQILKKLNPTSATIVFPSAHINSPASMFGHTFLRLNSKYKSKLLSYAINYAANVNQDDTNGILFAINGLVGGYHGQYSMLPYYEKLKEYRDSEQRDIWEYDLNLSQKEVIRMFQHIWELNGVYSDYYFFTENCSYNMLWLLEVANANKHLREYFTYQVSPLETIHAMKDEGLITSEHFRDSKRRILLKYEDKMTPESIGITKQLVLSDTYAKSILEQDHLNIEQKQYIFESAVELLEYKYIKSEITKKEYLRLFHKYTTLRALLGRGNRLSNSRPVSPLKAHRQARVTMGIDFKDRSFLLGVRPVYHDLEDNAYGLLRGTQIEFLHTLLKVDNNKIEIEDFTLLSIVSLTQFSEFFKNFSWRTHIGWDKSYIDKDLHFNSSIGGGMSVGNSDGYVYMMSDIITYAGKEYNTGLGASIGMIIDNGKHFQTNIEITKRWYTNGNEQNIVDIVQSYSPIQNIQWKFEYQYNASNTHIPSSNQYRLFFNYYF